jgi:hypothetical protein
LHTELALLLENRQSEEGIDLVLGDGLPPRHPITRCGTAFVTEDLGEPFARNPGADTHDRGFLIERH